MADFKQTRDQLNQARAQKSEARLHLFIQQEKLKKVKRAKDELGRIFDENKSEHVLRHRELESQENEIIAGIEQGRASLNQGIELEEHLFDDFIAFSDPREQVSRLSDEYPFLLLPVRIETRFKEVEIDERTINQLWLRIFPDDCAVDSFEPFLSETEFKNARAYWSEIWQAGGIEEKERDAWRALVASHGSGRAAWLIENYEPLNPDDKLDKDSKNDVILVIPASSLPPETDRPDILNYWKSYWLADGDDEEEEAALSELINNLGEEVALQVIKEYIPNNISAAPDPPIKKTDVTLKAQFLLLPVDEETNTTQASWTQAPRVNVMPDRFVVIGYSMGKKVLEQILSPVPSPIIVGPDPSAEPEEEFQQQENGDLSVTGEMKWMVDFEEAIKKGLGHKINLSSEQAEEGFDRLIVLGLKLSADEKRGQQLLEELFEHHHYSRKGLGILPQGTPTNNTEVEGSGYRYAEESDASFDRLKKGALFEPENNWLLKKDGQWLAECLGLDYDIFQKVRNSGHTDQSEARMMNTALWPGSMGYMMETMMQPVFDEQDIETTRMFFNRFVSGRGTVPAIHIGPQPYGILPTTAFSKMVFSGIDGRDPTGVGRGSNYLQRLHKLLIAIDSDWTPQYDQISYVGKSGDPHQILLDIIGLNPASVEFYQRYAESFEELFNRFNLMGFGGALVALLIAGGYVKSGKDLLAKHGYDEEELPDILEKFFLKSQNLLTGPLIDDRPLSETEKIRVYTPSPGNQNYIEWLIKAAGTSHDALRKQEGFIDDDPPSALLYLMLHHALDLSFVEVSHILFQRAEIISDEEVRQAKLDPAFLHVQENVKETESKWKYLYQKDSRITGDPDMTVGTFIPTLIKVDMATEYLAEQLAALEHLKDVPTARLERVFTEHIDCCTYRLDAWKWGLINYQLSNMRFAGMGEEPDGYKKGLYLGSYGWLEDVRSENKELTEAELDPELEEIFNNDEGAPSLYQDDTNGGYISAPSLNHAVTAAVLRNGYLENATEENPDTFSVNLSSKRVRKALALIEGIRSGQGLSELLGYQLERGLHDGHPGLELDFYIHELRRAFPLRANRLKETQTDEDTPIEQVEASNVVDGLALINHIQKTGNSDYPFGKNLEDTDNSEQSDAINLEVQNIMDMNDAVADIAISEGVFQVVQGNYDRGAATLDTYSKGNFPPVPDVVQTPRSGINITHRVGLHLEPGVSHTVSPNSMAMTVRAEAEPSVNKWLDGILPAAEDIACIVEYFDHSDNSTHELTVTQENLGLQPIDLLYLVNTDSEQAMTTMDDLIVHYVRKDINLRPDSKIVIHYISKVPDKISFFELSALTKSLRALILRSKPLQANDIARPNDAKSVSDNQVFLDVQRLEKVNTEAENIKNSLTGYFASIDVLVSDPEANRDHILNQIDSLAENLIDLLLPAALFGLPETGTSFFYERRSGIFNSLNNKIDDLVQRWENNLAEFDDAISAYNALPADATDEEKFNLLRKAERFISTVSITPLPGDPDTFRDDLITLKNDKFLPKLNAFRSLYSDASVTLSELLTGIKNELPISDYDLVELTVKEEEDQILVFAEDLHSRANGIIALLEDRLTKVQGHMEASDASTNPAAKVNELEQVAKLLFGDDFRIIPEFELTEEQADEWSKSLNDQDQLLDYAINTEKKDFPVDEWMYGTARVREKMHHWENATLLTEAFSGPELTLQPTQLPYIENDHWLALSFPEDYEIESDRLLYTAHYAINFDKTQRQCGLLIDEWNEMIPSKNETVGITFHYDRPNTEPPQTMLIAMPSRFTGEWEWEDLLDILNETLEMAKKRAVEPDQLDSTSYARFLPSIVSSVTVHPITVSMNLAFNNQIYKMLTLEDDE